jgi:hypothetical protein
VKSRRCVLAFAVVIALTAQAKAQAVLDDQTPCSAAVEAFDSHDKEKMREVVAYIFWAARSAPKGGAVDHPFRVSRARADAYPAGSKPLAEGPPSRASMACVLSRFSGWIFRPADRSLSLGEGGRRIRRAAARRSAW